MRTKVFRRMLLWIGGVYPLSHSNGQSLPSDHAATKETVALYRHLQGISGKGFLFGHQDDLAYGYSWKYQDGRSDIKDVTGDYPALYGWELGRLELDQVVNIDGVPFDKMKTYIRQGYERGGVITISWHLNNPLTGGTAWQPAPGTMAAILPGGTRHILYRSWLDKVAGFLRDLKGTHGEYIPVVLRIFHEINGNWFWWGGGHASPEETRKLWQFTVHYLRDEKKIHHLLYAYNTDRFGSKTDYLEKYPGDQWVDILGFDIYQRGEGGKNGFAQELDATATMLESIAREKGKIPALTEFGFNGLPDSTWWTSTFGQVLCRHHLAYAMAWRNAGPKKDGNYEFYVPYKGQASSADFLKFYKNDKTLFQKDITKEDLYR